jgi:RNA polymerase sigma-70 factor, ECF subfamily
LVGYPVERGDIAKMEDRELVQRLLDNDEAAFNYFWETYYPRLLRFAKTLVHYDQDTAEDLTQEIFIHCLEKIDQFEHKSTLSTWLMRILYYKALHVQRKASRHTSLYGEDCEGEEVDMVSQIASHGVSPDQALAWKEAMAHYQEALDTLKDAERTAWVLRQEEGLNYDEIVEVLGKTANTWRISICRTKERIVEMMGKDYLAALMR